MTGSNLWTWKRRLGGPELSFVDSSIYSDPESALRVDTMTPLSADRVLIEFRGLGLKCDTPEERRLRVRDHNTIWGPFGRNLPEDLLGVTSQGRAMQHGSEPLHVLHGRREHSSIHDEVGLRCYYAEWSRRTERSARDPYKSDCEDWTVARELHAVGEAK